MALAAGAFYHPSEYEFIGARLGEGGRYEIHSRLAAADFGQVGQIWRARDHADGGRFVIIKTAKDPLSANWTKEIRGSRFMLENVKHDNLMQVIDICRADCPLTGPRDLPLGTAGMTFNFIVLEHCFKYDLFSFLEKRPLSHALARHLFRQIVAGIAALHALGGAHRDLKPDNVLLSNRLSIKVGDFGFAREIPADSPTTRCVGTANYNAPECRARSDETVDGFKQDIWMLGSTLFVMLTQTFPFEANPRQKATRDVVLELFDSSADSVPEHSRYWECRFTLDNRMTPGETRLRRLQDNGRPENATVCHLINSMWNRNIAHRPSAAEVLAHPWLNTEDNGEPYREYDMEGAIQEALRIGHPQPGSLLDEMCQNIALGGGNLLQALREARA